MLAELETRHMPAKKRLEPPKRRRKAVAAGPSLFAGLEDREKGGGK